MTALAAALLANDVRLIGRSFKYHRPRGIVSAGPEEPNALVQVGLDPEHRAEPTKRPKLELRRGPDGTHSQNCLAEQWTSTSAR